jgi:hypothetical protein
MPIAGTRQDKEILRPLKNRKNLRSGKTQFEIYRESCTLKKNFNRPVFTFLGRSRMPLSFNSTNHGNIAFGFFNIESDMLLLENMFFFADDFCRALEALSDIGDTGGHPCLLPAYMIDDPREIGDLMDAIHKVRYTGFIGRVYALFPFPNDDAGFKQNPEGFASRKIISELIEGVSEAKSVVIKIPEPHQIHISPYVFTARVFRELILYVWQGGYPRWKDEIRPPYVIAMKKRLQKTCHPVFKGVFSS